MVTICRVVFVNNKNTFHLTLVIMTSETGAKLDARSIAVGKEILPLERYNWLYHTHFVRNEFDECIERMNVESEYCLYLKGLIRVRQGDPKSALQQFNQLKSINNTTYIKAIARCLLILSKHQNVCDMIKEVGLKVSNSDWQLWTLYGHALLFMGATAQAKEAFQSALANSNQVEPFIALAKCHISEHDFKSAIFVLRRATDISPNDVQLATKLGVLLYTTGLMTKGIEKILQADGQTSNPDLALTLAIGTILQEVRGDADGALQRYRQVNVFECPSLWNNIGLCLASKNKFVAAITCLKKAFFLNPLDWRINYNLGLINLKLKQYASAFQYFKNAVAYSHMANPSLLTLLAVCLEFLNDPSNALQAHQTACKATDTPMPLALVNHALFLAHTEHQHEGAREQIVELLMEFEKAWLKRNEKSNDFDDNIMRTATALAEQFNLSPHLSWVKAEQAKQENLASSQ